MTNENITTATQPFPANLPKLPDPPTGHRWEYRGKGWKHQGTTMGAFCDEEEDHWCTELPHDFSGHRLYHYAEAVPITEPNYQDRAYQKSVLDAAWDGVPCEIYENEWAEATFAYLAGKVVSCPKIRIKSPKPSKKRVPLTPDDIPAVCWVRRKNDKDVACLVVGLDEDGISFSQKGHVTYEDMFEDGWEYSEDRCNWKPAYREEA